MSMCELDTCYTISEIRKRAVESSDGLFIGRVIDFVFDKNLHLHSFIIGGSRWEELREAIGLVEDNDPIVLLESIAEITDEKIKLKIPKEKLVNKLQKSVFPEGVHTYSELKRMHIVDSEQKKLGKIVSTIMVPSGEIAFIVGGNWFEETTEKLGFKENIDLLLPYNHIKKIENHQLHIDIPLKSLKITVNNKPLTAEEQREYLNSIQNKNQMKMRLLEKRRPEEFRDFARFL
ncbi:MAG: PRC-barrel domain-containing protein [Candidatus Thorarchaeota archaeon]